MNGYPPQYPGPGMQGAQGGPNPDPYGQYGYMQQGQRPQQQPTADDRANQLAQQIMGQQANNPMAGMTKMIAGAGMGLRNYQKPENQFPAAPQPATPSGQTPGLSSMLQNLFSGSHTGGLF